MRFIILPGTPPSQHHYNLWIDELKQSFQNATFHYFDYMAPQKKMNASKSFELMKQHLLKRIESVSDDGPTIIIAHSFGAYFLEDILENPMYEFILIFPFIGAPNWGARLTLDLAFFSNLFYRFTFVQKTFRFTLTLFMPESRNIQANELVKGIETASMERQLLRNRIAWKTKQFTSNSTLIFNNADRWSPGTTSNFLKKMMKTVPTKITHDFVLYKDQRILMSDLVKNLLHKGGSIQGQPAKE